MEIWKQIKEHPNYEISNKGNVRSKDKYVETKKGWKYFLAGRILKPWISRSGYLTVQLTNNKRVMVHRIVAETFVENPESKRCVNHINGIKTDNRVENLEWVTHSENNLHARDKGLSKDRIAVKQINPDTMEVIATYKSLREASEVTGINYSAIAYCARGKYKTSGGFIWERVTTS